MQRIKGWLKGEVVRELKEEGEVIGGGSIMRESRAEPSNHTPRVPGGGVDGSMAVPF